MGNPDAAIQSRRTPGVFYGLIAVAFLVTLYAAWDSVVFMVGDWDKEEYNHSYLIPLIAVFLFIQRLPELSQVELRPSWWGVGVLAVMLAILVLGELSTLYTIVQYAFVGILAALMICALGVRGAAVVWASVAYLFFMVPLPDFLLINLSQSLQLLSSEIGVFVIRLFGISVYLEGNVIDLGVYQMQVVEACSGLRYLFPLTSFGFLIAYLFQAPFWQRAVLFLSTIPITVLMNSFRIGVIGVLVEHWGIGMAEGFLHYFEGWIIFISCLAILLGEIWLFHKLSRNTGSVWDRLDLSFPQLSSIKVKLPSRGMAPLWASAILIGAVALAAEGLGNRQEIQPARTSFIQFPLLHNGWVGREESIETEVLDSLKLTDYLIANYRHPDYVYPVNLYLAYYGSQRKGASIHSPRSCIPGGGWEIQSLKQVNLTDTGSMSLAGGPLEVNRVLIQKGRNRQLVYYWFEQRGRHLTNEYLVKWYLFWDALTLSRTDGALIRMVVPVPDGHTIASADDQLRRLVTDFYDIFPRYVPQ